MATLLDAMAVVAFALATQITFGGISPLEPAKPCPTIEHAC